MSEGARPVGALGVSEPLEHRCSERDEPLALGSDGYGTAIDSIFRDDHGVWWGGNGEYGTRIRFCPFCGIELATREPVGFTWADVDMLRGQAEREAVGIRDAGERAIAGADFNDLADRIAALLPPREETK